MEKTLKGFLDHIKNNYEKDYFNEIKRLVNEYSDTDSKVEGNEYGDFLIKELDNALKQFGAYTYADKGAHEVMFVERYVRELKKKPVEEIAKILSYVLDNHSNSEPLVNGIITDLDSLDEDDFEKLLSLDDRFEY